jgi:hypothetical protein
MSGQVFKGTWNMTDIALKVLKTGGFLVPSSAVRMITYPLSVLLMSGQQIIRREVEVTFSCNTNSPFVLIA